jgi:hypothetical protein
VNREGERLEAEFVQDLTSFVAQGDFLSVAGLEDKTLRMTGPEPISFGGEEGEAVNSGYDHCFVFSQGSVGGGASSLDEEFLARLEVGKFIAPQKVHNVLLLELAQKCASNILLKRGT